MDETQRKAIDDLRSQGYAVVIFTPEEIPESVNVRRLEDCMVGRGADFIEETC